MDSLAPLTSGTMVSGTIPDSDQGTLATRTIGLIVTSVVPAALWTFLVAEIAYCFDAEIEAPALAVFGSAVTVFLAAVCSPLMLRD
jgi:hypothetical protein